MGVALSDARAAICDHQVDIKVGVKRKRCYKRERNFTPCSRFRLTSSKATKTTCLLLQIQSESIGVVMDDMPVTTPVRPPVRYQGRNFKKYLRSPDVFNNESIAVKH